MRGFKGVLAVVFAVVVCGVLALGAGSAFAGFTYPFDGEPAPAGGSFGNLEAGSVAVDDSNGKTYVADSAAGTVSVFETASGSQLAGLDGSLTPAGSFGGGQVEVAANNGTGDVYALDSTDNVVDVFEPGGGYLCQITGSATPSASECNGVAGSPTEAGPFNDPGGIAVDQATGDIYVVDAHNGVVDVFGTGGAYLRQISLASVEYGFSATYTRGIAVNDFNGDVYVSDSGSANPASENAVYVFNASGEYLTTWTGANTPAKSFGNGLLSVAADNANGLVYVTETKDAVTDVFESSGGYAGQISHSFVQPEGTAVGQASGKVYVSNSFPSVVEIFGPGLVIPDVTTGLASEVRATSATVNGTLKTNGLELKDCHFDYGTDVSYGHFAPCVPAAGSIPADAGEHAVSAQLTGLPAGVTYHFRLVAANENDAAEPATGEDATFEAPLPSIDSAAAANVTGVSADLSARIDPHGLATTYRFEWGTSTGYGTSVPVPDGDAGAGTGEVPVSAHLSGLSANTTYHWRIVARNENGTTAIADHTLVYDTSGAGLPDHRAYEMVTPPAKNGAQVGTVLIGVRPAVSEDGSRVIVTSIQCFGGADGCTASRGTQGDPFEFTRTSDGWVTTPLAPPATQFVGSSEQLVNADTGTALFGALTPSATSDSFYVRQPDGSLLDIGPVATLDSPIENLGEIGMTADLSHTVYELDAGITGDSVYEYVGQGNARPVVVGVSGGVGSTDLISVCATKVGGLSSSGYLSADGRTVFFIARACASGSGANAGVPVPADTLYARIDQARTVAISARSPLDCTSQGCLGSSPSAAKFQGASADGSKVFFTSEQRLTDSASEGSENLYEYDFANPAGHNLLDVSAGDSSGAGPDVRGVAAVSRDGSHVYFVADGVLSGVANDQGQSARPGANNLYVFERDTGHPAGRIAFVTALGNDGNLWSSQRQANVTPDGRFLVFTSSVPLTADAVGDAGAAQPLQVYRYDAQTGALVRVSVGAHGFNDNGNGDVASGSASDASIVQLGPPSDARRDPTMSDDGAYVFFRSPVGLTPQALNDVSIDKAGELAQNVYEWHEGQVYLISDGRDTALSGGRIPDTTRSAARLLGSDATGANVFFETADRLVGQDTDTQVDVYDARIGGGFPYTPPIASCAGEGCHGNPESAPLLGSPVSAAFSGPGNAVAGGAKSATKPKKKAKHKKRAKHKKKKARRAGRTSKHTKRGRK
jgi:DNA-binding beta-propeller fold protein YncE